MSPVAQTAGTPRVKDAHLEVLGPVDSGQPREAFRGGALVGTAARAAFGRGFRFGLVGFLLANGLIRRGCLPLVIAFAVFVIYGGALIGMVPGMAGAHISWQMHLGGFIGGLCASWHLRNERQ